MYVFHAIHYVIHILRKMGSADPNEREEGLGCCGLVCGLFAVSFVSAISGILVQSLHGLLGDSAWLGPLVGAVVSLLVVAVLLGVRAFWLHGESAGPWLAGLAIPPGLAAIVMGYWACAEVVTGLLVWGGVPPQAQALWWTSWLAPGVAVGALWLGLRSRRPRFRTTPVAAVPSLPVAARETAGAAQTTAVAAPTSEATPPVRERIRPEPLRRDAVARPSGPDLGEPPVTAVTDPVPPASKNGLPDPASFLDIDFRTSDDFRL